MYNFIPYTQHFCSNTGSFTRNNFDYDSGVKAIVEDEEFKEEVKELIEGILPLISGI